MSKIRRKFTKEEKLQIVNESLEDNVSNGDMGRKYDIHPATISRWRRELKLFENNAYPGKGIKRQTEEQKENDLLKKQLREANLENEILKKALGIISSPNRKNLLS